MWQDHVGTSALRCRSLASYVPLCSDLSESASCTAACIAGRQSHRQPAQFPISLEKNSIYHQRLLRYDGFSVMMVPVLRNNNRAHKNRHPCNRRDACLVIPYSINPLSLKSISISVPRTFFNTTLSISFSLKDNLMSVIGFLSMA